jgi:hypothetical protein
MKTRVAHGAALRPDLVTKAAAVMHDDRRLADCAEELFLAGKGDAAASIGTSIHEALARLNQGLVTFDELPAQFKPHAQAWQAALDAHGFEVVPEYVELRLVCDAFEVAGSTDALLRRKSDGRLVVADLKTGKSIAQRPIVYAVQCYLYAHGVAYDVATGERTKLDIDTTVAYLFHIPASATAGCAVYKLDLQGATADAAEVARQIHLLRKTFPKATPLKSPASTQPLVKANQSRRQWVEDRVRVVLAHSDAAKQELVRKWPPEVPPFKGDHQHTDIELNALVVVLTQIETNHDIPFGPADPALKRIEEDAVNLVLEAFPGSVVLDDEDEVDQAALNDLKETLEALPVEVKDFVVKVTHEASAAKRPLSLTQRPSIRRYEIAKALIAVAKYEDPEVARALVARVEPEATGSVSLGWVFGGLSIDQAKSLQQFVQALDTGALKLVFSTSGAPELLDETQQKAA